MLKFAMQNVSSRGQHSPSYRSGVKALSANCTETYLHQHISVLLKLTSTLTHSLLFFLAQDENMISFIKGGIKVRNSYQTYK